MSGFLAVVRFELRSHARFLPLAIGLSLVPLAVPLLTGVPAGDRPDLRQTLAAIIAGTFLVVLSLTIGATCIGTPLRERRLGFFYARPIRPAALWFGEIVFGWAFTLLFAALIVLPSQVIDGLGSQGFSSHPLAPLPTLLLAPLALLVLSHALSVQVGSRSPWLALDLVAAAAAGIVFWWAARQMLGTEALLPVVGFLEAGAIALPLAALLAGLAQVQSGRVIPARSHRVLSSVLWSTLLAFAAGSAAFAAWFVRVAPSDLSEVWISARLGGPGVAIVSGEASWRPGYDPNFILDTKSGEWLRIQLSSPNRGIRISRDGRLATWFQFDGRPSQPRWTFWTSRLDRRPFVAEESTITLDDAWIDPVLSDDGARLAILSGTDLTGLSLFETASGRLIGSARFPDEKNVRRRLNFAPDGALMIYATEPRERDADRTGIRISEYDPDARRISPRGTLAAAFEPDFWSLGGISPTNRLLLLGRGGASVLLADARTGEVLKEMPTRPDAGWGQRAAFLRDGRVLVETPAGDRSRLDLLSPSGESLRSYDLGAGVFGAINPQEGDDSVVVSVHGKRVAGVRPSHLVRLDLATGSIRLLGESVLPVWLPDDDFSSWTPIRPGRGAAHSFYRDRNGHLLTLRRDGNDWRLEPWSIPVPKD